MGLVVAVGLASVGTWMDAARLQELACVERGTSRVE